MERLAMVVITFLFTVLSLSPTESANLPNEGLCAKLIQPSGYPCTEHTVETKDGYLLGMQRVSSCSGRGDLPPGPPVLLIHGNFNAGDAWFLNSKEQSLGFILADSGFDVWVGNVRGTDWSPGHVTLSKKDKEFWDWSWQELALHDLPEMINFVYSATSSKVFYVGHSQGTIMALAAFTQPDIVDMVEAAALLSPISYLGHISSPFALRVVHMHLDQVIMALGIHQLSFRSDFIVHILDAICDAYPDCANLLTSITGGDEKYLSRDLPINEFAVAVKDAEEAISYRHALPMFLWKCMRWLKVGRERKLAEAWKTVDVFLQKYISKRREDVVNGLEMFDLLSSYIKSGDELQTGDQFLRDTMLSLFLAGHDTIASDLVWFLWLIAKTPHVEEKLVDELKVICMQKNEHCKKPMVFDSDDLKGSVYLHAAICESLRLYPPVPVNSKGIIKEDVLPDGTKVMPGAQILLSFYSEGRMPWVWGDDSAEFKPERWIDEDGKLKREPLSKFFAFNIGARSCLGKDISFTQMKIAIAAILFNFHI